MNAHLHSIPCPLLLLDAVSYSPPHGGLFGFERRHAPPLFSELSLQLHAGERTGLVGASGCGKSTLLRLLLGLTAPQRGQIRCDGQPLNIARGSSLREYRRRVQYVPQDPLASLAPGQTVARLLAEPVRRLTATVATPAQLSAALQQVELSPRLLDKTAAELSGGQAQRVALARALMVEPDYLLADEPVSGLDLALRENIKALLLQVCEQRQMGLLMVTHDISMVFGLCQRLLVMELGQIHEDLATGDVLHAPHARRARALLAAVPAIG